MRWQHTMAELLRAPTEGYAEEIVVLPILVEQFELKHSLINMMTLDQFFGLEKDNPHDHIRWFNKITSTIKYKDVPNSTIKLMLFPFSLASFTELHQLDTFYNALNPTDQDSLNSAAGGNLLERRTQDVLTIIENKSKVLNSRNKPIVSQVKSSNANSSSSSEIAKLTYAVNQQTSAVTTTMTAILKQFQATLPPAFVKAIEEICVTCGGANPYYHGYLKKLLEKLGDPGKFLISYGFSELKCKALADLGASINLMPLSVWKKLGLPELISTHMTLELANRVLLILGRPFLRTAHTLTDIHGEEMILCDGDESLTLNMRHDTSSYSNQPQKESINMINIYDDSCDDFLEDLFETNHLSGNPTLSSHTDLTSPKVKYDIFDPGGGNVLIEKVINLDSTKELPPPHNINPLKIEYFLNHDPINDVDSILEDSVDEDNLTNLNDNLVDTMPEIVTDEHALDYSSPPLYDEYDDDLFEVDYDTKYVYDDPFDSKEYEIKESKLLINELDPLRSSDFLSSPKYPISENLFEVNTHVAPDKNVKKLAISHASLILEDFDPPPLYELPFHKVPTFETLLSFSSKNEEKVFKPKILTSKGVHSSLLPKLSHRGPKVFKLIKILKSPMKIFPCSFGEDIRILDVSCLHFYPS
uniref:Reverse transcriptase domain-containing protein n=1 Tax=Tanacetum cinerariifolium TaxID=118510 RepID=A0A6L2M6E2_TANCI|nr:reverse transcriptase domain-containing protein [Tanacetum cinerariifolium]